MGHVVYDIQMYVYVYGVQMYVYVHDIQAHVYLPGSQCADVCMVQVVYVQ